MKSEYFYVDVEGKFCWVARENFTCNEGYAAVRFDRQPPSPGPRQSSIYDEVGGLGGSVTVNDMTQNASYGCTGTKM